MKKLALILVAGTALFLAVAMVQEWPVFAAWLGGEAAAPTKPVPQEAAAAVASFLQLSSHFLASAGDPRFADRLPAAEPVLEELQREVAFLGRKHQRQEQRLIKLEVLSQVPSGETRVEVRTKEYWVVRTFDARSGQELGEPRSTILYCAYRVALAGQTWKVVAWEHEPPAGEQG